MQSNSNIGATAYRRLWQCAKGGGSSSLVLNWNIHIREFLFSYFYGLYVRVTLCRVLTLLHIENAFMICRINKNTNILVYSQLECVNMLGARFVDVVQYGQNICFYFSQCSASMNCTWLRRFYESEWSSDVLAIDPGSEVNATELIPLVVTPTRTSCKSLDSL
jgi:hypothetical protein